MQSAKQEEWFKQWFESSFYEVLYQQRDESEAKAFVSRLVSHLQIDNTGMDVLDLACGSGRHAATLQALGFKVTGIDLSERAIGQARARQLENCHFYVHDMRLFFADAKFDLGVNLFTSLGYFENKADNLEAVRTFYRAIKPGGLAVIDFFNSNCVVSNLVEKQTKTINNVAFDIYKRIANDFVIKTIDIDTADARCQFEEKVQLLNFQDFNYWFKEVVFEVVATFGDYYLHPFDASASERLIMILKK